MSRRCEIGAGEDAPTERGNDEGSGRPHRVAPTDGDGIRVDMKSALTGMGKRRRQSDRITRGTGTVQKYDPSDIGTVCFSPEPRSCIVGCVKQNIAHILPSSRRGGPMWPPVAPFPQTPKKDPLHPQRILFLPFFTRTPSRAARHFPLPHPAGY